MDVPRQPVDAHRPDRFRPPHCPWPECAEHRPSRGFRWQRAGSYRRKEDPRRVLRFLCLSCDRTFSQQSFSCSYYMKRPELLEPIAAGLVAGSAHRQIARSERCAPSTVTRRAARIGRHSLLLQGLALAELPPLTEPVVLDHFETFVFSQDDRLAVGIQPGRFAHRGRLRCVQPPHFRLRAVDRHEERWTDRRTDPRSCRGRLESRLPPRREAIGAHQ